MAIAADQGSPNRRRRLLVFSDGRATHCYVHFKVQNPAKRVVNEAKNKNEDRNLYVGNGGPDRGMFSDFYQSRKNGDPGCSFLR